MEKKPNHLITIAGIVALLGVGAAVIVLGTPAPEQQQKQTKQETTSNASNNETASGKTKASTTTIIFTDNGFTPNHYTAKLGEAVTVRNDSSQNLQFSSDNHPSHTDHPEINLGVLTPGQSGSFTPENKGTYGFHDHLDDSKSGTLVVE